MKEEEVSKIIKKLRTSSNLTQQEFASKYNVSMQSVSKWENGINMPDLFILKQIAKDYNLSLDDLLNGNIKSKKNSKKKIIIIIIIGIFIISSIITCLLVIPKNDYEFKTIKTTCDDFNIKGIISYNNKKSSIYISNIEYCGNIKNEKYQNIECTLYETNENIQKKVSECEKNGKNITLENYLKDISFTVSGYEQICKKYDNNSLFLEINALNKQNQTITYKIPLSLEKCQN